MMPELIEMSLKRKQNTVFQLASSATQSLIEPFVFTRKHSHNQTSFYVSSLQAIKLLTAPETTSFHSHQNHISIPAEASKI